MIILVSFTTLVLVQNNKIKVIGEKVVNTSTPITQEISKIMTGLERTSSVMRGYFLTHNSNLKDDRTSLWDLSILPSLKRLENLGVSLSPEERRSIDGLGTLLKELKHAQDDLELYFDQHSNDNYSFLEATDSASISMRKEWEAQKNEVNKYVEENLLNDIRPLKVDIRAILQPLKQSQEGLLVEDIGHIHADIDKANSTVGFITAFFAVLAFGSTFVVIRILNQSIRKPVEQLTTLATGAITEDTALTQDELNDVIVAGNTLKDNLKKASHFAISIGNGEFETEFEQVSKDDMLGNALLQMRDKLQTVAKEDEKRNWATKGIAHFGEILRKSGADTKALSDILISELVNYVGAVQGGIFIYNDHQVKPHLELMATYAYNKKRAINKTIHLDGDFAEGLVGQVFLTGETVFMDNLPEGYSEIASGLGDASPKSVLIIPLKINEECEGVLELASFKTFEPYVIAFLERLGESITSTLRSVRSSERTQVLLEDTQMKSEQMKAQEEEMRQNMEELVATQEEMSRRQNELEKLRSHLEDEVRKRTQELKSTLDRFNLALEGTTEGLWDVILPKDGEVKDDTKFWWSPKFKSLLGYNDNEFAHEFRSLKWSIHPDERPKALDLFKAHLEDKTGRTKFDLEVRLKLKDNTYSWFRVVGTTLRDSDGNPLRFAGAINNISAQKSLEESQLVLASSQAKLNALINNTTDFIMGIDLNNSITILNEPLKEFYQKKDINVEYGKTTLWEVIPSSAHNLYEHILTDVFKGANRKTEFSANDLDGIFRHMEVQFTPIIMETNVIGVSIVIRDISEIKQKQIDAEVSQKQLQQVLDNYKAEVYLKDLKGRYIMVDHSFCNTFGKERSEIIGHTDAEIFDGDLAERIWASDKEVIETKTTKEFDFTSSKGKVYTFTKFPVHNKKGEITSICSIGINITEQFSKDSNGEVYKPVINTNKGGVNTLPLWLEHLQGLVVSRSKESIETIEYIAGDSLNILGLDEKRFDKAPLSIEQFIPEQSKPMYEGAMGEIHQAFEKESEYMVKYHITDKNGTNRLILEKGVVTKSEDGTLKGESLLTDISNLRPQAKKKS